MARLGRSFPIKSHYGGPYIPTRIPAGAATVNSSAQPKGFPISIGVAGDNSGVTTTLTITVPTNPPIVVPVGSTVVIRVAYQAVSPATVVITDTAGNSYKKLQPAIGDGSVVQFWIELWYAYNVSSLGSANTIVTTINSAPTIWNVAADYLPGIILTDPIETFASATGTVLPALSNTTPALSSLNQCVYGFICYGGSAGGTALANAPYIQLAQVLVASAESLLNSGMATIVSYPGGFAIGGTPTIGTSPWAAITVTFRVLPDIPNVFPSSRVTPLNVGVAAGADAGGSLLVPSGSGGINHMIALAFFSTQSAVSGGSVLVKDSAGNTYVMTLYNVANGSGMLVSANTIMSTLKPIPFGGSIGVTSSGGTLSNFVMAALDISHIAAVSETNLIDSNASGSGTSITPSSGGTSVTNHLNDIGIGAIVYVGTPTPTVNLIINNPAIVLNLASLPGNAVTGGGGQAGEAGGPNGGYWLAMSWIQEYNLASYSVSGTLSSSQFWIANLQNYRSMEDFPANPIGLPELTEALAIFRM